MAGPLTIGFSKLAAPTGGTVFILTDKSLALSKTAAGLADGFAAMFKKAAGISDFEGGQLKSLDILAPAGAKVDRVVAIGLGEPDKMKPIDWFRLGGAIGGLVKSATRVTVLLDRADGSAVEPGQAASVAQGIALRSYAFEKYKSQSNGKKPKSRKVKISVAGNAAAARAWKVESQVADGVSFARDLVNEPANMLGPIEFAERLTELKKLGVSVDVLDEKALNRNRMGALMGVARGSSRPPRVVVMTWKGGKAKDRPVAFVG
ncbi:MAG TPA: M17 family peptidase N-terminal domain-containing protein, partial [Afifellaceae bacterium]|nr:M17 family peptidase N-terminal domain-containing protein [Afifellaceae bacterium]